MCRSVTIVCIFCRCLSYSMFYKFLANWSLVFGVVGFLEVLVFGVCFLDVWWCGFVGFVLDF
jgi:hypothetical protein